MTRGVTLVAQRFALVALLCAAPFALQEVHAGSFTPLGDLSGGSFYSYPIGISADGLVVVGFSDSVFWVRGVSLERRRNDRLRRLAGRTGELSQRRGSVRPPLGIHAQG